MSCGVRRFLASAGLVGLIPIAAAAQQKATVVSGRVVSEGGVPPAYVDVRIPALAGKAPNVEVVGQSGEPGASSFIRIRGQKTIRGTGQPLIVVDGMPVDNTTNTTLGFLGGTASPNRASDLNPNDVANIEILKGAADAAVYGARAGQGV